MHALAPHLSEETLTYHYGKHHQAYVNLNQLVADSRAGLARKPIQTTTGAIFNNAAQLWNHSFYWQCLSPQGGQKPTGSLAQRLEKTFGSFEQFQTLFTQAVMSAFCSAWVWLVVDPTGALKIVTTANAGTPMTDKCQALLTCDVWEHAYYIDYRNRRADYLKAFWELVNWTFVASSL